MLRRVTMVVAALSALMPVCGAGPAWLNPENLPPQLKHPLKLLATTAMSGEGKDYYSLKPGATATIDTIAGPAIIFRVWSTSSDTKMASLDMIVDGKKEVLYEQGKLPPTVMQPDPLRGMDMQAYWSYIPIFVKKQAVFQARSFEKNVTEPMKFYLQAGYRQVPAAELAQAGKLDLKRVREQLGQAYALEPNYWGTFGDWAKTAVTAQLSIGKPWAVPVTGPALVHSLKLQIPDGTSGAQLQTTRLVVTCDGVRTIDAPLGVLFNLSHRQPAAPIASTAIGTPVEGNTLILAFPMPVAQSLTVSLERFGRGGLESVEATIAHEPLKSAPKYRLCAQYFSQISVAKQPMTLLNVTGEGIFVGTNLSVNGLEQHKTFAFLEGNEQIYIDGDTRPTIEGTGTEDYFNNAWYFEAGEKTHLFHGVTFKQDRNPPTVDCYRYLISDCVPFQKSLRFDLQHGSRNGAPNVLFEGVMFWYQTPPVNVAEPVAAKIPPDLLPPGMEPPGRRSLLIPAAGFVVALVVVGLLAWWALKKRKSARP